MSLSLDDTIAALASPPGPALRGVVRLSGDTVREIAERVFTPDDADRWRERALPTRHRGHVALTGAAATLPVEAWYWPTPRSYTGQPSLEFHCIGSPPLLDAVLAALYAHGARPARAGEFTLRAFLAGRIDLLQAEAVLGVIDATDETQLSAALSQLAGGISARMAALHESLLIDLADLEAGLDFVDEDIEFVDREQFRARLATAAATIEGLLAQAERRLAARSQARVVLAGLPNAGKSTLFNTLLGREAAIVSPVRGTTRDWLRADIEWNDCPIELLDTAGRETAASSVSAAAQFGADDRIAQADLVVWCTAADLSPDDLRMDAGQRNTCRRAAHDMLCVTTKWDLRHGAASDASLAVSARSGAGLDELRREIARRVELRGQHVGELLGSTAARCRDSLREALAAVQRAGALLAEGGGDELIAIELRGALEQTGQIAGQSTTDDLLDRIFSRFCIGK